MTLYKSDKFVRPWQKKLLVVDWRQFPYVPGICLLLKTCFSPYHTFLTWDTATRAWPTIYMSGAALCVPFSLATGVLDRTLKWAWVSHIEIVWRFKPAAGSSYSRDMCVITVTCFAFTSAQILNGSGGRPRSVSGLLESPKYQKKAS